MDNLIPITYLCTTCGEENEALVDPSGGSRQTYTEDCAICCRPNVLRIHIPPGGNISLEVESEG